MRQLGWGEKKVNIAMHTTKWLQVPTFALFDFKNTLCRVWLMSRMQKACFTTSLVLVSFSLTCACLQSLRCMRKSINTGEVGKKSFRYITILNILRAKLVGWEYITVKQYNFDVRWFGFHAYGQILDKKDDSLTISCFFGLILTFRVDFWNKSENFFWFFFSKGYPWQKFTFFVKKKFKISKIEM